MSAEEKKEEKVPVVGDVEEARKLIIERLKHIKEKLERLRG